jgi:hypothetical protein
MNVTGIYMPVGNLNMRPQNVLFRKVAYLRHDVTWFAEQLNRADRDWNRVISQYNGGE